MDKQLTLFDWPYANIIPKDYRPGFLWWVTYKGQSKRGDAGTEETCRRKINKYLKEIGFE